MRLFFAVLLPESARSACERVQSALRVGLGEDGIRWTAPAGFHYTIKFLGETASDRLPDLLAAASDAAANSSPFSLTVANLGVLPEARRPQTLYLGMEEAGMADPDAGLFPGDGVDETGLLFSAWRFPGLGALAECLERRLTERGFAPETRCFYPHLTLARVRAPAGFAVMRRWAVATMEGITVSNSDTRTTFWESMRKVDKIAVFEVEQFALVSSELHRDGPIYTVLETFPLIAT